MNTLKDLRPGDHAYVEECSGNGAVFQRLCELGVVRGARIRVIRCGPFGDPIQVAVGESHLSFRKAEAALVRVSPSP